MIHGFIIWTDPISLKLLFGIIITIIMSSKKIFNTLDTFVPDAVDGILLLNPNLRRIGNYNILVRHDIEEYKREHITLISGGGSGHEPAHAGFIGEGMLSAAVLGNVFASPSVS